MEASAWTYGCASLAACRIKAPPPLLMALSAAVVAVALVFTNQTAFRLTIAALLVGGIFYYAARPVTYEMAHRQTPSGQKRKKEKSKKKGCKKSKCSKWRGNGCRCGRE